MRSIVNFSTMAMILAGFALAGCGDDSSKENQNTPDRQSGDRQTGVLTDRGLAASSDYLSVDLSKFSASGSTGECWDAFPPETPLGRLTCEDLSQEIFAKNVEQICVQLGSSKVTPAGETLDMKNCQEAQVYTYNFAPELKIQVKSEVFN